MLFFKHKRALAITLFFLVNFLANAQEINNTAQKNYQYSYQFSQSGNHQQAFFYAQKSAKQNYAPAQHNLGLSYLHGLGVEKDQTQAFVWFEKAAKQGLLDAKNELAMAYYLGRGVMKNLDKAQHYWQQAAQNNDEYAQFNLASLYLEQGNKKKAYHWFMLAKKNQHPKAETALKVLHH